MSGRGTAKDNEPNRAERRALRRQPGTWADLPAQLHALSTSPLLSTGDRVAFLKAACELRAGAAPLRVLPTIAAELNRAGMLSRPNQ